MSLFGYVALEVFFDGIRHLVVLRMTAGGWKVGVINMCLETSIAFSWRSAFGLLRCSFRESRMAKDDCSSLLSRGDQRCTQMILVVGGRASDFMNRGCIAQKRQNKHFGLGSVVGVGTSLFGASLER